MYVVFKNNMFTNGCSVLATDLNTFVLIFVSVVEPTGMLHQDSQHESYGFLLPISTHDFLSTKVINTHR